MNLRDIQKAIAQWGRETFGSPGVPAPARAIAARMNVEVAELLLGFDALELTAPGSEDRREAIRALGEECADIGIMLVQVADALRESPDAPGVDLEEAMDRKMEINRNRTWLRGKTGKVQHVDITPGPSLIGLGAPAEGQLA